MSLKSPRLLLYMLCCACMQTSMRHALYCVIAMKADPSLQLEDDTALTLSFANLTVPSASAHATVFCSVKEAHLLMMLKAGV